MNRIGIDVWASIASRLDLDDLFNLSFTCRFLFRLRRNESVCRSCLHRQYGPWDILDLFTVTYVDAARKMIMLSQKYSSAMQFLVGKQPFLLNECCTFCFYEHDGMCHGRPREKKFPFVIKVDCIIYRYISPEPFFISNAKTGMDGCTILGTQDLPSKKESCWPYVPLDTYCTKYERDPNYCFYEPVFFCFDPDDIVFVQQYHKRDLIGNDVIAYQYQCNFIALF